MNLEQSSLPIHAVLDRITERLHSVGVVLLKAPPGAGKTTGVPTALLDTDPGIGRLLLAQPRRLAARAAAARMANLRGGKLGEEVGYQVRFDRRWNKRSRIVAVTTGVLLRLLHSDPYLNRFDAVVLDEFHERSLEADLALGIVQRLRQSVRPDLKLIIMSATLDPEPIVDFFQRSDPSIASPIPSIESLGRSYPVEIRYRKGAHRIPIEDQVAEVLPRALTASTGHVLIFLPGVGEIRRVQRKLSQTKISKQIQIMPLFGDMASSDQDAVLNESGTRKIVLATNVAETSVTIPGVTAVIDSGLARVMRCDAGVGIPKLEIEPISRASAEQRAGRAGRTEPGICYRLWPQQTHQTRPAVETPEVLRSDLAGAVLHLVGWGETDVDAFPWLDPPSPEAIGGAFRLLRNLDAVDDFGITTVGKRMLTMPVHPRLARLLIAGESYGVSKRIALVAALLSERDPFFRNDTRHQGTKRLPVRRSTGEASRDRFTTCGCSDVVDRLTRLEAFVNGAEDRQINQVAARHVMRVTDQLISLVDSDTEFADSSVDNSDSRVMRALLAAYPDRLAKRRPGGGDRALMVGGQGVRLAKESQVRQGDLFLCIDVMRRTGDATVRIASAVEENWLDVSRIRESNECFFHPTLKQVTARHRTYWEDLMLSETPTDQIDTDEAAALLYQNALGHWDRVFPVEDRMIADLVSRVRCLRHWIPGLEFPDLDDSCLRSVCQQLCHGRKSFEQLRAAPWREHVQAVLSYDQNQILDTYVPLQLTVPSGNKLDIQYKEGKPPIVEVRLQELFGLQATPTIAGGAVKIQLHLLGPNYQPQQVTDDLDSFWKNTYPQVRKDLRRRYSKHDWPEDPYSAIATRSGLARDARKTTR